MKKDKSVSIEYQRTKTGYMRFNGLNEYPGLNDIKYIIESTLHHFSITENDERFNNFNDFLKNTVREVKTNKNKPKDKVERDLQFRIEMMDLQGCNTIVQAESMKGEPYKKCNDCGTYNKLEINNKFVCIECEPSYQKLYGND